MYGYHTLSFPGAACSIRKISTLSHPRVHWRGTEAVTPAPTRNRLGALRPTRVRIPPSPPTKRTDPFGGLFVWKDEGCGYGALFDKTAGQPFWTPAAPAPAGRGTGMARVNPALSAKCKRPQPGPFTFGGWRAGQWNPPGFDQFAVRELERPQGARRAGHREVPLICSEY